MDSHNVTFAHDDESSLKHTKVFLNKNLFHCYHNNRGYCSFRDRCRYQHFREICTNSVCREKECKKRHPVLCRYKDSCKFLQTNNCAFKHLRTTTDLAGNDFKSKMKVCTDEIKRLESEINDLKHDIDIKKKELLESRMEIQKLNIKLTQESDIHTENKDLKKQIEALEIENKDLKNKLQQKDQINDENSLFKHDEKECIKIKTNYSCEKCCLTFSSKGTLSKHKNDMHKAKLTF